MRLVHVAPLLAGALAACAGLPREAPSPAPARALTVPVIERPSGETAEWWFRAGAVAASQRSGGQARARNVILFVGDGMGISTVSAARIFQGQRKGQPGEENQLAFERFQQTALSRTYNVDSQTPDSAGTMTAMITGAKTRKGVLSVAQGAARGDCAAARGTGLVTALELAEVAGLATGVVTTTRLTHATPGATYAHSIERNWENDSQVPAAALAASCRDIARQFLEFDLGNGIEVALGGGRKQFLPKTAADPEYPEQTGARADGRNLIAEWQGRHSDGRYVWNLPQLRALDLAHTRTLLGLFEPDHLNYEHDRSADAAGEPSLADMTRTAITVLRHNPQGFFLVVEGGRIDHAHHGGNAYRALDETVALSDAVQAAVDATSEADTLIIATADHSHTLTFVGYPRRGNPILGKVEGASSEDSHGEFASDATGLPYTTLSYANGPGYAGASGTQAEGAKRFPHSLSGSQPARKGRPDLSQVDTEDPDYMQEALLPLYSESHGGEDVGVWARGPGSDALRGSIEQNQIFHVMVQSQPALRRLLCSLGDCENGVPVRLPAPDALSDRDRKSAQAR